MSAARSPSSQDDDLRAVPADAVLVHIGMHKTGTTAMQSLLATCRDELHSLGIDYPGGNDAHHAAARALIGWSPGRGLVTHNPPSARPWERLARKARRRTGRVVISSEFLSRARPEQVARLVDGLGPERVQIVVGVRNLAATALSSWQQSLKTGNTANLNRWLRSSFRRGDGSTAAGGFWEGQDPGATVVRWAAAAGADRVYAVVIDEGDRALLPTTFEQLLALPAGMLAERKVAGTNRGMTAAEAELVRAVNRTVRGNVSWPDYATLVRYGVVRRLVEARTPGPGEQKPVLPDWALSQALEEGRRVTDLITEAGVHVVGSLANLTVAPETSAPRRRTPGVVPIAAAAEAVVGAVAGATRGSWSLAGAPPERRPTVDELSTRTLAGILAARVVSDARGRTRGRRSARR